MILVNDVDNISNIDINLISYYICVKEHSCNKAICNISHPYLFVSVLNNYTYTSASAYKMPMFSDGHSKLQRKCYRQTMQIGWWRKVTNNELYTKVQLKEIHSGK